MPVQGPSFVSVNETVRVNEPVPVRLVVSPETKLGPPVASPVTVTPVTATSDSVPLASTRSIETVYEPVAVYVCDSALGGRPVPVESGEPSPQWTT